MIGVFLPLPMGYRYELATTIDTSTDPKTWGGWVLHIGFNAPCAGDGQRNVRPLYGMQETRFKIGDVVRKRSGARWSGRVCGFYSTDNTPIGYAVESRTPESLGSVQIYPESALELGEYDH